MRAGARRNDGEDARQLRQLVQRARRSRLDERDSEVLTLRHVELHVENHLDRIERKHAHDENGHGKRDAQRSPARGLSLQVRRIIFTAGGASRC